LVHELTFVMNEHIDNEPPEIEDNPEQDNIDVEDEPIPPQEPQKTVFLKRFTRERRSAVDP
jgi:hypothetical protein